MCFVGVTITVYILSILSNNKRISSANSTTIYKQVTCSIYYSLGGGVGHKTEWAEKMPLFTFEKLSFLNGRKSGFNVAVQNK